MMAAKPKSRATGQQQQQQPEQPQQQQQPGMITPPTRRRTKSLSAGVFWKLGVPIVILLSVFTVMDRVRRDIEDMYSIGGGAFVASVSKQEDIHDIATTTTTNKKKNQNQKKSRKGKHNDQDQSLPPPFGIGFSATTNEDRISERQRKRDQRRSDIVHDKGRKKQSDSDWFRSSLGSLSRRHTASTPPKTSTSTLSDVVVDEEILLFDYNQPAVRSNNTSDITNTTTLNEPTADYSTAKTIVFVMSAREHFEQRAVIRQTWGKDHAVYFVTGGQPASEQQRQQQHKTTSSSSTSIQDRLVQEQATHQDLIDSIHPESYRGLPHKLKFAYQWILQHWPHVQWLVKVDDDTVVRMDTLQAVVLDTLNPAQPIVAGRIIVDAPVHRDGKWAELLYTESETYPYWPQGSCGHVVSRPVAEYLTQKAAAGELTLYQGEDTSLGIWLHEASVKKELHVTWFKSQYFTNNADCHSRQWLIIGHQISPARMKACYARSDEWTEEYRLSVSKNLWHMNTEAQK
jgi:hypothetical protein